MLLVGSLIALPILASAFDVKQHLGNLSPYFPAPKNGLTGGLATGMPPGCQLSQLHVLHRHGSRLPLGSEVTFTANLSTLLNSAPVSAKLDKLRLPDEWRFIQGPNRWSNTLGVNDLTAPGRKETFDHGVQFKLTYPTMPFHDILVGNQDRVVESAQWFQQGLFGRKFANISSFDLINEDNITISSITPMDTCPKWQYSYGQQAVDAWGALYLPRIQSRVNQILKPVTLSIGDVHGALYACAYELAAYGNTTWCDVFTQTEILDFEYELDLLMRNAFGYGLPGDMGPVLGSAFVNNLVNRLTNSSAAKTYVEFGHDTSIDMALTALGLAKDKTYPTTSRSPSRAWRTSHQVTFAAHMVWEKWACGSSTQVRLLLNEAPMSLAPICAADRKTGACAIEAFVKGTAAIRSVKWGDAHWNSTCGNLGSKL